MAYDFIGKVILITGGAGGIGAATARELYSLGALLVLTDMQQEAVDQLAQEFDAERVLPLALDVTDAEASKIVVQSAVERFGRLDVAFANAGIAWRSDPKTLRICPSDEFRRIVEVDLFGVWNTMQAALPEVIRNQGQILVTSSIYAFINGLVNAPYAASKAGVEALARALLVELGGTGATVSVIYPGWTETAIAKIAFGGNDLATRMNETVLPNYLRQPIQPQQVAKAITKGMRTRRPRIVVPGRWTPIALLRGLLNPLIDRYLQRHKALQKLLRELESGSDAGS